MLLAIDVGNTHVVIGLYQSTELIAYWRLDSDSKRTVDEFALQLLALLSHSGISKSDLNQIVISCVVPHLGRVFRKIAVKYFDITPLVVEHNTVTGVEIHVDSPESVGADRIVNAVACKSRVGAPAIIVDFGTATTFDVLNSNGAYVGGIIAPGVLISAEALFERAALLPQVEFGEPCALIGKNTRDSMQSGVYYGYVSLVEGVISRLKTELGADVPVVATGGIGRLIAESTDAIDEIISDLTLEGLRLVAEMNS